MVNLIPRWLVARLNMILITLVVGFCFISPAIATTQEIQLNSLEGYVVKTTFSYDKEQGSAMIKEQGVGKTNAIDWMKVSFYNPSGELIATYDNIVDGVSQGNYFEFNFEPATQQLSGNIDLGGEFAGEMYLKGEVEQGLSLIEVAATGEEKVVDRVMK